MYGKYLNIVNWIQCKVIHMDYGDMCDEIFDLVKPEFRINANRLCGFITTTKMFVDILNQEFVDLDFICAAESVVLPGIESGASQISYGYVQQMFSMFKTYIDEIDFRLREFAKYISANAGKINFSNDFEVFRFAKQIVKALNILMLTYKNAVTVCDDVWYSANNPESPFYTIAVNVVTFYQYIQNFNFTVNSVKDVMAIYDTLYRTVEDFTEPDVFKESMCKNVLDYCKSVFLLIE